MINVRQDLAYATREAGRQAAAGMPMGEIHGVVAQCMERSGFDTSSLTVTTDEAFVLNESQDAFQVTVSIPYADVAVVTPNFFEATAGRITVESIWPRQSEQ